MSSLEPRTPNGPARRSSAERAREQSPHPGGGRGFARRRAFLLSGSPAPGALRAYNSSLWPVCGLCSRPSREQDWGDGEGASAWIGKGWSRVPSGAGESFSSGAFSGAGGGERDWSLGGRGSYSASPNPEFRARLLLENAAFLAGGVHRPLPLPPGLRARLEVSERGRYGGSRPARALAKAGAPCGSPRAYPGDGVTGGREWGSRSPRVRAPQTCYTSRNGTRFRWEKGPCTSEFFSETAQEPGAPGLTLPLYGRSGVAPFSWLRFPGSRRWLAGEREVWAIPNAMASCPCQQYPWGTLGCCLQSLSGGWRGKGCMGLQCCRRSSPTLPRSSSAGETESGS